MLLKINHIQGNPEQETGPCFLLQMHLRSYRRSRNIPWANSVLAPLSFLVWFSVLNGFQGRFCPWSGVLEVMVCKSSPHHTGKCGGPLNVCCPIVPPCCSVPLSPPAATGWRHHAALDTRSASSCYQSCEEEKTTQIKQNTEAPTATIASAMNDIPIPA